MVIDYRQPGLYLVSGDSVKNFSVLESLNMGTAGANPPIRTLAAEVEWVFIALQKRRQMVAQIEVNWLLNGQPSDDAPPWMNTTTLQRIDQAIQLYAKAYMHKRRTRGGGVDALGWLDPTTVTPHETGIKSIYDGYATYVRNSDAGAIFVPREDLLIFEMLGTAELAPDLSAGGATRLAAGILRALSKTADTIFDNNAGLPLMLVKVPAGVVPEERDKLADRFQRLFNRNKGVTGELSTVGVPEGVEVVPLSLKPADLAMDTLAQPRITAILAAHDVPKSMVMGDTANFATAEAERQNFALSIGYRLKHLADIINRDPDIQKMGWEMDVQPEKSAVSVETE